jgi:hypothetical protein
MASGHAYDPVHGQRQVSIASLTRDTCGLPPRLRPENATLVIVGDTTSSRPCRCSKRSGDWKRWLANGVA